MWQNFGNFLDKQKDSKLKANYHFESFIGDPLGVRTQDPNIKSVVLYRLS